MAVLVCLAAGCVLNYFRPHKNPLLFWITEASYALTACKYLLTTLQLAEAVDSGGGAGSANDRRFLVWFLIGFDVAVYVAFVCVAVAVFFILRQDFQQVAAAERDGTPATGTAGGGVAGVPGTPRPPSGTSRARWGRGGSCRDASAARVCSTPS